MRRYCANLGFLWTDLPLTAAVAAAAQAGFAAIEVHFPYATPAPELARALERAKLPLICLNTDRGGAERFGLSALPDATAHAHLAIDQAIAYARISGAGAVHVMAGIAKGTAARAAYHAALSHACDAAPDLTILIEPINPVDVPGYFMDHPDLALDTLAALSRPNLRIMADCYHLVKIEGLAEMPNRLRALRPYLGHVQFAGLPDRGPPSRGLVLQILATLADIGWEIPPGAEYRPPGATGDSLGWMTL